MKGMFDYVVLYQVTWYLIVVGCHHGPDFLEDLGHRVHLVLELGFFGSQLFALFSKCDNLYLLLLEPLLKFCVKPLCLLRYLLNEVIQSSRSPGLHTFGSKDILIRLSFLEWLTACNGSC